MNPVKSRSVYRYFEPADTFVQILLCDAAALELEIKPGLNRAGYRKAVVRACMPEFRTDLETKAGNLLPDDPLLAEDLLFQLCIEVNPALDIHTVRLRGDRRDEDVLGEPRTEESRGAPRDFHTELRRRAQGLGSRLEKRVVGQKDAIEGCVRAVERAASGLGAGERPLGTFLLVGRTGTGKTELAKALASELFATQKHKGLVRIDCAEFALAHEYSKLIGAPPGYVGHEDGGQLTETVLKNPESIVLFDEIEKAHPRLHNLMLSILEEGVLTDSKGRHVSFERTLVVMTSNAGAAEMIAAGRGLGFERNKATVARSTLREIARGALEAQFSPEFLGRIDDTILFGDLDVDAARTIAQKQLTELAARARKRACKVAFTPAIARWVATKGFSVDFGARELRRVIHREIEAPLSKLVVSGAVGKRDFVRVRIENDTPVFDVES